MREPERLTRSEMRCVERLAARTPGACRMEQSCPPPLWGSLLMVSALNLCGSGTRVPARKGADALRPPNWRPAHPISELRSEPARVPQGARACA